MARKDVVAEKQLKVINEVDKARTKIERAIDQDGPFTHNLISLTLSSLADKVGTKYANDLVVELDLEDLYGIFLQEEV